MPATNATSERSFSALHRVKTYFRSTMSQMCLNNLLILHTHKDKDLTSIGKEFVALKDTRVCFDQRLHCTNVCMYMHVQCTSYLHWLLIISA